MTHQIVEQGAVLESKTKDGTVPIRIIAEGRGSTAVYTREFLQENKDVFANRPMYMGHPEDTSRPWKRPPEQIAGRTGKVVEYKVVDGVAGLYTDAKPRGKYRDLVEEFGDLFGVSVFAPDSKGRDEEGDYIVESIQDSPLISVDFVAAAGAGGRIEALVESLAAIERPEKPSVNPGAGEKETHIMEEKLDKLISLIESFITDKNAKAVAEAQAEVNADAISKAVSESLEQFEAKVALIEAETELLPSQRAHLREQAKAGADVAPLIESAKKIVDEAKALVESAGDTGRSFASKDEDWTVAGVTV